jgi:hypothetical protein
MMTVSESDALLAEPLPTSALSHSPEPLFRRDVGQALCSPLQPGSYPEQAGVLAHPSGRLYGPLCESVERKSRLP